MSAPENTPWIRRKSTIVGGVICFVVIIVVASIANNPNKQAIPVYGDGNGVGVNGLGTAGQTAAFNQTFAQKMREEQAKENQRLQAEMQAQIDAKVASEAAKIRSDLSAANQETSQQLAALLKGQQEAAELAASQAKNNSGKPLRFVQPKSRIAEIGSDGSASATDQAQQGVSTASSRPVIPPNGFVKGRLLNGVVATVGEQPTAFLVALEGMYQAANGYTVNLNGCMASVEGKPNIAAGRIDGKPAEITCNFESEGRVQTWQVAGWIVDADDGIRGLNSIIVDNTGKKITASALASGLAAAGAALNDSQYNTQSSGGSNQRIFSGSAGGVVTAGAITGAGQGLNNAINEHYQLYKATLQKGANSKVTLVITNELPVPAQGSHITQNTNVTEVRK